MKPIYKLGRAECRWPLSTNTEGVRLFCAEPCASLAPYCTAHHERSLPDGVVEARPLTRFTSLSIYAGSTRCERVVPIVVRPFGQEAREIEGQRPPKQRAAIVHGARGALVDAEGYEIADREPDLVTLFASSR